jgi:hypothetical protein
MMWCERNAVFVHVISKFSQLLASKYSCMTSQRSWLTMSGPSTCCDNGTEIRQEKIVHVGLGGVSNNFVWENIDSFPTSQETFCNVHGPQFNTAELDVVCFKTFLILPISTCKIMCSVLGQKRCSANASRHT